MSFSSRCGRTVRVGRFRRGDERASRADRHPRHDRGSARSESVGTWSSSPDRRGARAADARTVADVYLRSRHASVRRSRPRSTATTTSGAGSPPSCCPSGGCGWPTTTALLALLVLEGEWVDQLYVDAPWFGRGLGSTLLPGRRRAVPAGSSSGPSKRTIGRIASTSGTASCSRSGPTDPGTTSGRPIAATAGARTA